MENHKFKGTVVWIELATGELVDSGTVDRAIQRSNEMVMDLRSGAGEYAVGLRSDAKGNLEGEWTKDHGVHRGQVKGTLAPHSSDATTMALVGPWGTSTVMWACLLRRVEAF